MATLDWIRKAAVADQPLRTRIRARYHLWMLGRYDRMIMDSMVGDAGYELSNMLNGGKTERLVNAAGVHVSALADITVTSMEGLEIKEWTCPFPVGELVQFDDRVWRVLGSHVTEKGPVRHLCKPVGPARK
jgi:hypothetical protein